MSFNLCLSIVLLLFLCYDVKSFKIQNLQGLGIGKGNRKVCVNWSSSTSSDQNLDIDNVFGSEFIVEKVKIGTEAAATTIVNEDSIPDETVIYSKGQRKVYPKRLSSEKRAEVMKGYDNLRTTFIFDSVFLSVLGLCATWYIGSFKDAFSYGIGAALGLSYAFLLSRYVEKLVSVVEVFFV